MDDWAWEILGVWSGYRVTLPVGPLFCVIEGNSRGRAWATTAVRAELRRLVVASGVRRRFAPHQYADPIVKPTPGEGVLAVWVDRGVGVGITRSRSRSRLPLDVGLRGPMRTNAASARPIDGPSGEGAATHAVYCVAGAQSDVMPGSADGLCCFASAAQRALEMKRDYADVSDR